MKNISFFSYAKTNKLMLNMKKEYFLNGLGCANCAAKIEIAVGKLDGVNEASVNFATATLIIELKKDYTGDILPEIEKIVHSIESHVTVSEKQKRSVSSISKQTNLPTQKRSVLTTLKKPDTVSSSDCGDAACNDSSCNNAACGDDNCSVSNGADSSPSFKTSAPSEKKKSKFGTYYEFADKKKLIRLLFGVFIYIIGILIHLSHSYDIPFFSDFLQAVHGSPLEYIIFIIAYLLIGGDVLYKAIKGISLGHFFDESFLMMIATIGAFLISDFAEAVAVMLFYQVGEFFQEMAVAKSRRSIQKMMDIRPDYARLRNESGGYDVVSPYDVSVGDVILVKPGEKIPLDGTILSGTSFIDTSSLTGEFVPKTVHESDSVLSGSINKSGTLTVRVDKSFEQSTVSKILDLIENAAAKKAPTEKFITKFSRYYTPAVILAAALVAVIPSLVLPGAAFEDWIYRGLVFLVISCPCALVISIPLSYFGGIGASSKKGILIKGSNYLEGLTQVKIVVFDKTGTLSKGVFDVVRIDIPNDLPENSACGKDDLFLYSAAAESLSNHPIALSIVRAAEKNLRGGFSFDHSKMTEHEEISGFGIKAVYSGKNITVGNLKLMTRENIPIPDLSSFDSSLSYTETHIYVAVNGNFAGRIVISDEVKADSKDALARLKQLGIEKTVMVTGDADRVGRAFAADLGLDGVYTEQLPHEKVETLEKIDIELKSKNPKAKTAFVGDGINDAPALTRADIGIAVGGIGSDAAVEAADVVLMTGEPTQLADAFDIAKKTKTIVYQNIFFALGIKVVFMILGLFGIATMWEAVFADVGVTIIAVFNSMRLLRLK